MSDSKLFQDVILKLLDFWKDRGCIIRQPYNVQVGAGTMNPATILRVLGPEPWNVVYVEPSIRPDDGRFGDNPNRMQMHHQLQVILKPDPGNPQEQYLDSLKAIGIDPREHDIRFVEDNWESPALGAWGLGWEVWLDGQEITQFTYFQQAGSLNLDPVCVELTYGLDRIILALQDKDAVWEIDYSDKIKYREVFLQSEIEHCKYYFNVADVDALREVYNTYERECGRCIEAGLVVPAHDYNLKCSQIFNVLDTRGAIGVTERANYFKRMRNKARQISELYSEQRQRLEYPFADIGWELAATEDVYAIGTSGVAEQSGPQTFVLEIGQEELPPDDLDYVINHLNKTVREMLDKLRLTYDKDALVVDGTPRRVAIIIPNLAEYQTDLEQVKTGPRIDRAYDVHGNPTKAILGFARGLKIDVSELRTFQKGKRQVVGATIREKGKPTVEILSGALPKLLARIKFKKSMRWNSSNVSYSRPLRWFVALFGEQIVPFSYANVSSGNVSRGLRPYDSPALLIKDADSYESTLRENGILLRKKERQRVIVDESIKKANELNGRIIPLDSELLNEVTHLVESPTPFIGRFDQRYLDLPADILVAVMRKHQRYFPVYGADDSLLNAFIGVRNGDSENLDIVQHGNKQVIRARFSDAEFFYSNDRNKQLNDFVDDLDKLTFQFELGSMKDKLHRLEKLTPAIAEKIGLSDEDAATAARAASLSKADLASHMVVEMTSLQGVMGGYYAKMSGESDAVAAAISEQYNSVSKTPAGLALALADRIDSLVGLTAAGLLPKDSNDPFALRRAAIQIIENFIGNEDNPTLKEHLLKANLLELVEISAATQPLAADADVQEQVLNFIKKRLESFIQTRSTDLSVSLMRFDIELYGTPAERNELELRKISQATAIKAILKEQAHNPLKAWQATWDLIDQTQASDWHTLLNAYARCVRITRKEKTRHAVETARFTEAASRALHASYETVAATSDGSVATLIAQIRTLTPAITDFFDHVLVMDEDMAVRNNRLGMLQSIAALANGIADLSKLEGF